MRIIGLMSGTSYDAIDVAAADLHIEDEVLQLDPLGALTLDFEPVTRAQLAAALPPHTTTAEAMCRIDTLVGHAFAAAAQQGIDHLCHRRADAVVSHGQTLYHWVDHGRVCGTLQLGNPAWIAERTSLPVVSDLRSRDVACGGQGAPLVSAFDALLLSPKTATRAALNIGGIANMTIVRPDGPPLAYDLGPGNALIDAATQALFDQPCDHGGRHAKQGSVRTDLLAALQDEPYYATPPPKTTGKELFHWQYVERRLATISPVAPADVVATLTELTARLIVDACTAQNVQEIVASGGGTHNPQLMARITTLAGKQRTVRQVDEYGIPTDAKEAYAFTVLGYLTLLGIPGAVPTCTGAQRAAVLGNITPGHAPLRLPKPSSTVPQRLAVAGRR